MLKDCSASPFLKDSLVISKTNVLIRGKSSLGIQVGMRSRIQVDAVMKKPILLVNEGLLERKDPNIDQHLQLFLVFLERM